MKKLVIERSRWGVGVLCDKYGKMCALGFVAADCGVPEEQLKGRQTLYSLSDSKDIKRLPEELRPTELGDTPLASDIANANDCHEEGRLAELLGKAGYELLIV